MDQAGDGASAGAAHVPRITGKLDVTAVKLSPSDGYLYSRIDGKKSIAEIADEANINVAEVEELVQRLVKAGLASTRTLEEDAADTEFAASVPQMPIAPPKSRLDIVRGRYSEAELDEPCDLDMTQKKTVLDLFHALEDSDYYMLLGVPRDADRKAVKNAYYLATRTVHPDKFFRKNLGSFKPKMELVFGTLTLAHDTLTDDKKRDEYNKYLAESFIGMEAMLSQAVEQARHAQQQPPTPGPPPVEATPEPAPVEEPVYVVPEPEPPPPPSQTAPVSKPPDEAALRARREALARRLMGTKAPAAAKAAAPQPVQSKEEAMEALKKRYDAQMEAAAAEQAKVYAAAARESMAKKSYINAANSYRLALALNANDPEINAAAKEAFAQADEILSENYTKTARDEERNENWPEASRLWLRVAQIKTGDAVAADRAANALEKAKGDLRQAADLAKRAIGLAPKQVGYRITLANVYIAAGMTQSAKHELEVALELSPTNKQIPTILKSLKK